MLTREMFRSRDDVARLTGLINSLHVGDINIMEVCGTHTMAIAESGIKQMLPENVRLISGPGCPVCVTPSERIDDICHLSENKNVIIATYGDMIRVPGTNRDISLEKSRINGATIKMVYSSMDALDIALNNPGKEVVFLGIGFETTAPSSAAAIVEAYNRKIDNFSVFSLHKTVEPAMRSILSLKNVRVDGFLLPGHVAIIIGEKGFEFLERDYKVPGVIGGFEPLDILDAIYRIMKQIEKGAYSVENEYTRLVKYEGNKKAMDAIDEVFEVRGDYWRGLGFIDFSGLGIREKYKKYDTVSKMGLELTKEGKITPCRCGDVLTGLISPSGCPLFGSECTPDSPIGPCMVSSEGTCAAAYKYR